MEIIPLSYCCCRERFELQLLIVLLFLIPIYFKKPLNCNWMKYWMTRAAKTVGKRPCLSLRCGVTIRWISFIHSTISPLLATGAVQSADPGAVPGPPHRSVSRTGLSVTSPRCRCRSCRLFTLRNLSYIITHIMLSSQLAHKEAGRALIESTYESFCRLWSDHFVI